MIRVHIKPTLFGFICSVAATLTLSAQTFIQPSSALQYPVPAFPYYHFRLDLKIPSASYLEYEVQVDGKTIRHLALKDAASPLDANRTLIQYRPSFADNAVRNNQKFTQPYLVGWLAWQGGKSYKVDVTLRVKNDFQPSSNDRVWKGTITLTAPAGAKTLDPAWKNFKSLVLTETEGVARVDEPIEQVLAFYGDEAQNLKNDLRVFAFDAATHALTEVPSQAYDLKTDVAQADALDSSANAFSRNTWKVPIWVPTITARVAFQANVPAKASRIYFVCHNNPNAKAASYTSALSIQGPAPGLTFEKESGKVRGVPIQIANDKLNIRLHPHSGVLDEVALKSNPKAPLFHKKETNGSIHWAPEAYPPPRPWTHTSDWMQPNFRSWSGPVVVTTLANAPLPVIPEVDAAVSYKLYPNLPYIISTTTTRVNEPLAVQAMRNGEVVFARELITHLAWFDVIENTVKTVELDKVPDLDEVLMEENTPWLSFFNPTTGIAFGGIQLESSVSGLEHQPRTVNPYLYCIVGPIVYWSRAMNFTFASSAPQLMVEVPKGTQLWEKWAYVLYEPKGTDPHAAMKEWQRKLTHPLRVRLTEEVEGRVPTVGTEIYIDPSKTGWEGRKTLRD